MLCHFCPTAGVRLFPPLNERKVVNIGMVKSVKSYTNTRAVIKYESVTDSSVNHLANQLANNQFYPSSWPQMVQRQCLDKTDRLKGTSGSVYRSLNVTFVVQPSKANAYIWY